MHLYKLQHTIEECYHYNCKTNQTVTIICVRILDSYICRIAHTPYLCWWLFAWCSWSSRDLVWYSRLTCIHGEEERARVTSLCGSASKDVTNQSHSLMCQQAIVRFMLRQRQYPLTHRANHSHILVSSSITMINSHCFSCQIFFHFLLHLVSNCLLLITTWTLQFL